MIGAEATKIATLLLDSQKLFLEAVFRMRADAMSIEDDEVEPILNGITDLVTRISSKFIQEDPK